MYWNWLTATSLVLFVQVAAKQAVFTSSMTDTTGQRRNMDGFKVKDGDDVLSPFKMLELPRPQSAIANAEGSLALVPVSQYSFEDRK